MIQFNLQTIFSSLVCISPHRAFCGLTEKEYTIRQYPTQNRNSAMVATAEKKNYYFEKQTTLIYYMLYIIAFIKYAVIIFHVFTNYSQ